MGHGLWRSHPWTVKVDPDTVFLPGRLRTRLKALRAPERQAIYIRNCNMSFGFFGAIEVLSRSAVSKLAASIADCQRTMVGLSGEDGWMRECLDAIGVGHMDDFDILRTPWDRAC